jgi:hypothetical protein
VTLTTLHPLSSKVGTNFVDKLARGLKATEFVCLFMAVGKQTVADGRERRLGVLHTMDAARVPSCFLMLQ